MFRLLIFSILIPWISCDLWCYSCVSSQPGCEEFYVDWRIHHAITCPRDDDKCVKIIERKGVDTFITRDCLSNLEGQKKDIPADRYDGCRKAAEQPKLAVYVENHITQLEIKNEHWDEVTYCFCEFDQWCNHGHFLHSNIYTIFVVAICCFKSDNLKLKVCKTASIILVLMWCDIFPTATVNLYICCIF